MNKSAEFIPKLWTCLKEGYSFLFFKSDLLSGITVGIIALPLAMAFAIASGVGPERGLWTAIVAGFLISALGGSRVQIGGPTGAFVVLVFDVVQRGGYAGLAASTLVASLILILLGLFRLGSWIKYVPHSLVTGFTTGIALLIFSSQIRDFFSLQMDFVPASFVRKWMGYFYALPTLNLAGFCIGVGTLLLILAIRKWAPRIPWGIAGIVAATAVVSCFQLPVETIQSRFGVLPRTLPVPSLPYFGGLNLQQVLFDAIAIALLGGIESLLSAVIGDGMMGGRHRSNCELIAQGIANFGSVLFGGIPATGAIARTAANVKTGAKTPVSGIIHAFALFTIMAFFAPWVSKIPLAALAAILMMVAWNMSELHHFTRLLRGPKEDRLILLTAFLLTVFVDITFAIVLGMIIASLLFMKQMSNLSKIAPVFQENNPSSSHLSIPAGVEVYEVEGPFFFGAADILKDFLRGLVPTPKVFVLQMDQVPFIDASGLNALQEFYEVSEKRGSHVIFAGVRPEVNHQLKKFGLLERIGEQRVCLHLNAALELARQIVENSSLPNNPASR